MTVRELKTILNEFNPTLEIVINQPNNYKSPINSVVYEEVKNHIYKADEENDIIERETKPAVSRVIIYS